MRWITLHGDTALAGVRRIRPPLHHLRSAPSHRVQHPQGHAGNQHNARIVESAGRLQECHAYPMYRTPWRRWLLDGHHVTVCKHPYGHLTICRRLDGSDDGVVPLLRDAPTGRLSGEHPHRGTMDVERHGER